MPKRGAGQLDLNGAAPRSKGVTERAAEKDLRTLRSLASVGAGMAALETAYRLTAREVDRAETEHDRWGKLKATSELRAIRERLGSMAPMTAVAEADVFWARIAEVAAAAGVHLPAPVHPPQS